jgi:histidyl-tRNA synthetase
MFKTVKRGDKLDLNKPNLTENDIVEEGLRYDLTVPLVRFYINNREKLPTPFKAIQIDEAFRAERPQRGRIRQFTQCDIDILGSSSTNCEVELIDTTAKALLAIGIENFKVRINDRRILKNLISAAGFELSDADSVCITFDKLDKIGTEGVRKELLDKGFAEDVVEKFVSMMGITPFTLEEARKYCTDTEAIDSVASIIDTVKQLSGDRYQIEYDRSLVRGQGYYTGTVFEVASKQFGGTVAGGGRYDNLIGRFTGDTVPAVGFSIGFERIFSIVQENNIQLAGTRKKTAVLYKAEDVLDAIAKQAELENESDVTLVLVPNPKKIDKVYSRVKQQGFDEIIKVNE